MILVAVDANGKIYWYEKKPIRLEQEGQWDSDGISDCGELHPLVAKCLGVSYLTWFNKPLKLE